MMHNNELGLLCDVPSRALENNASAWKKKKQTKEKEREEQKYFLQKKKIAFVLDVEVK